MIQELKSSKKRIVGLKQTVKAIKDNRVKKFYIAIFKEVFQAFKINTIVISYNADGSNPGEF